MWSWWTRRNGSWVPDSVEGRPDGKPCRGTPRLAWSIWRRMLSCLMKIVGYKLVIHRADLIEEEVTGLLEKGWQPLGAPAVSPAPPHSEHADTVYQAMVLYGDSQSAAE